NTRIKWGRCGDDRVMESVSLPADESAWQEHSRRWDINGPAAWVVAGVQPAWRQRLLEWLRSCGHAVRVVERWEQLGLEVRVQQPERVGIDRLFNAVAANVRRKTA